MADATDAEVACFETGVKFGTLYHQFAGAPVSVESAPSLARAIERSIENQPHCTGVTVDVREDELREAIAEQEVGYVEFTGRFVEVEVRVEYEGHRVRSRMDVDETGSYPLMRIESIERPEG